MKGNNYIQSIFHLLQLINEEVKSDLNAIISIYTDRIKTCLTDLFSLEAKDYHTIKEFFKEKNFSKEEISQLSIILNTIILKTRKTRASNLLDLIHLSDLNIDALKFFSNELYEELELSKYSYPELYEYIDILKDIDLNYLSNNIRQEEKFFHTGLLQNYIFKELRLLMTYYTANQIFKTETIAFLKRLDQIKSIIQLYEIKESEIMLYVDLLNQVLTNQIDIDSVLLKMKTKELKLKSVDIYNIYGTLINLVYTSTNYEDKYSKILSIKMSYFENYPKSFYHKMNMLFLKNTATICIRCSQIDWFHKVFTKEIVNKWERSLKDVYELCLAKFLFHSQNFEQCNAKIQKVRVKDIFIELELRRIQIMCFYELGERVLVDNYLNTFKIFIYRNQDIQVMYKESNNNFMKILQRINKTLDVKKLSLIQDELKNLERVAEKNWLIEKASFLESKLK